MWNVKIHHLSIYLSSLWGAGSFFCNFRSETLHQGLKLLWVLEEKSMRKTGKANVHTEGIQPHNDLIYVSVEQATNPKYSKTRYNDKVI